MHLSIVVILSFRAPNIKWFVRCVGDQLSACLMNDNGVTNVIVAILDGMPGKYIYFQKCLSKGQHIKQ